MVTLYYSNTDVAYRLEAEKKLHETVIDQFENSKKKSREKILKLMLYFICLIEDLGSA